MASLKVTTGIKVYDIEDENGEIRGQIKINTTDYAMLDRARQTQLKIKELLESMQSEEDSQTIDNILDQEVMIDKEIKEQINYLFDDNNTSNVVFGNISCLSTQNGKTFVERFLETVMPVINKDFENEMKKSQKRIEKYTSQVK